MIRRRTFAAGLGAAFAWSLAARAQQKAMPIVGLLNSRAADEAPDLMAAFRRGLQEAGYVEDQNVAIEVRFANNQ